MDLFEVTGKRAIVTGGSRGLGRAMAKGLLENGCEVAILASNPQTDATVREWVDPAWKYHCVVCDLSREDDRRRAFEQALAVLGGKLDILINSAGIQRRNRCVDFTPQEWDEVVSVNMTAVFFMSQLAARVMVKQGHGKIINVASMGSYVGSLCVPAYVSTKGAIVQMTKALSNELAPQGVCVNAIAPGYMLTEMARAIRDDPVRNKEIIDRIPMGRWGDPEDLVGAILFLSSEASNYVTGTTIVVDGGFLGR